MSGKTENTADKIQKRAGMRPTAMLFPSKVATNACVTIVGIEHQFRLAVAHPGAARLKARIPIRKKSQLYFLGPSSHGRSQIYCMKQCTKTASLHIDSAELSARSRVGYPARIAPIRL